jgi:hypothetical protein
MKDKQGRALSRRTALAFVGVAGVELIVGGQAEAGEGPPEPARPGQAEWLVPFAITFIWDKVMTDDQRQGVRDAFTGAVSAIGRGISNVYQNVVGTIGGRSAPLTVRIQRHPAGHLVIGARLEDMDGDGKPEMTHSGTAPHARHPDMRGHAHQSVSKAHTWLRAHKM